MRCNLFLACFLWVGFAAYPGCADSNTQSPVAEPEPGSSEAVPSAPEDGGVPTTSAEDGGPGNPVPDGTQEDSGLNDTSGDGTEEGIGPASGVDADTSIPVEPNEDAEPADTKTELLEDGGISGSGIYPPKTPPETLGGDRLAKVFVPLDYDPGKSYPLIFNFHGYGGNSVQIDSYFKLSAYVSSRQFILVIPDGLSDLEFKQYWNTPDCCDKYAAKPDDLAYVTGMVAEAKEKLAVDASRIYAVGLSNGGFMAHHLACNASEVFAGIVSLAGVSPKDPSLCNPGSGVSVLQVHGTLDAVVPYGGSFLFRSVEDTLESWRALNQCNAEEIQYGDPANYDYVISGPETEKQEWKSCGSGSHVALWKMVNSAHVPFLHPDFTPDLLDWLYEQSKP